VVLMADPEHHPTFSGISDSSGHALPPCVDLFVSLAVDVLSVVPLDVTQTSMNAMELLPFLLDTGAAVSVLPKGKLLPLLPKSLHSYTCPETRDNWTITAFGGHIVTVKGPYVFPIEILTHRLMHKFYVIDAPSPFIAGYYLVVAAHLIIDAAGRTVYSRNPDTNSYVSASPGPYLAASYGRRRYLVVRSWG